jgi:putative NADH-flavin reductase
MKVAVLGASGRAGSEIVKELAARGHAVLAVARKPAAIPSGTGITAQAGDASDPAALASLIAGNHAVISALHFDIPVATLLAAVRQAGMPRLLVTGAAASLEVAPGKRLVSRASTARNICSWAMSLPAPTIKSTFAVTGIRPALTLVAPSWLV